MTGQRKIDSAQPRQDEKEALPQNEVVENGNQNVTCGLIMPIASNEVGTAEHWLQVRKIISDALQSTGYKIKMVSDSDEVNIIHQNIVENIYTNEIIVCDVSSRNPNVMFELGMRLTFDKPVVIIKDKETPFSFDVGNIQHLEYPRSLNYVEIQSFQHELRNKVISTLDASKEKSYSPFLKNYKITQVSTVATEVVGRDEYIISAINDLKNSVNRIVNGQVASANKSKFEEVVLRDIKNNGDCIQVEVILERIYGQVKENYDGRPFDTNAMLMAYKELTNNYPELSTVQREMIIEKLARKMAPFSTKE